MSLTSPPLRVAILGLGSRGADAYGGLLAADPRVQVVAGADADRERLAAFAERTAIPTEARFADWRDVLEAAPALELDAVVIALPDRLHVDPTLKAVRRGLAVLVEKPLAPTPAELQRLADGIADAEHVGGRARIAVCHVLRESPFWRSVKAVVDSGALGELLTIRHEENIGFWHFAHSYVRGIWRREDTTSPMILAKTCHDLDLIRWIAGEAPTSVSSVGALTHFTERNAPEGAPERCVDGCPAAASCPFFAPRYYEDALAHVDGWPVAVLGSDTSPAGRRRALATGPYGRCVYRCDNTVVDHQQTVYAFPSGLTATLSTSGLTGANTRRVFLTGSRGELRGAMDDDAIEVQLYAPDAPLRVPGLGELEAKGAAGPLHHPVYAFSPSERWHRPESARDAADHKGHGGGDAGLIDRFVRAALSDDFHAEISTGWDMSVDSHRMAFAAEEARLTRQVVPIPAV